MADDEELIDAYLAGRLDEAGQRELEHRLRSTKATRETWCRLSRLDLALRDAAHGPTTASISTAPSRRPAWWLALVLLVAFLAAVAGWWWTTVEPPTMPVASDPHQRMDVPVIEPHDPSPPPTAFQSFAVDSEDQFMRASDARARGWKRPWVIHVDPNRYTPDSRVVFTGSEALVTGDVQFVGRPRAPFSMGRDSVRYVRVTYRTPPHDAARPYGLIVSLWDGQQVRQAVTDGNGVTLHIDAENQRSVLPQRGSSPGLQHLVIKVAAAVGPRDQLLACRFSGDALPGDEPPVWHFHGPLFDLDGDLDSLRVRANGRHQVGIIAVAVGETWASVAGTQPPTPKH